MKILQVSSLHNQTPPKGYGGTERFVDALATSLTANNIEVDVIAKKGSTSAIYNIIEASYSSLERVLLDSLEIADYDLIHLHIKDGGMLAKLQTYDLPIVVTIHNNIRKNSGWIDIISDSADNLYFSVISKNLRMRIEKAFDERELNLQKNISIEGFGMNLEQYLQLYNPELHRDCYTYIGVIARYKGVLDIVKYFSSVNKRLVVVGPCNDPDEKYYFEEVMEVINDHKNISYHGETKSEVEKIKLLNRSKALIIATGIDTKEEDCHEAFGLVMLEANALGTPVLGYNKGNISDYIKNGWNGYKFERIDELKYLISKVEKSNLPAKCIDAAKQYDINKVVRNYIDMYTEVIT